MKRARIQTLALLLLAGGLLQVQCAALGGRGGVGSAFDPLGFPGDDTVLTAGVEPRTVNDADEDIGIIDSWSDETADNDGTILRVQFFATTSLSEAEDMKQRATASLSEHVSIDFETPYYKLKVGPLTDEDVAARLVVKLRAMGYESAWIVRDRAER